MTDLALLHRATQHAVACILGVMSLTPTHAQVISEGHVAYSLGALRVLETPRQVLVFNQDKQLLLTAAIKPGGRIDPDIQVSDRGVLMAGTHRLDITTGRALADASDPARSPCRPTAIGHGPTLFAAQGTRGLLLTAKTDANGRPSGHEGRLLDLVQCRQLGRANIDAAKADAFFEYKASAAGWWLVGSQGRRVLVSPTGLGWQTLALPANTHNVLTADWRRDGAIWILANQLVGAELKLVLFQSQDLGQTWTAVEAQTTRIPAHWFEARRQLAAEGR